MMNTQNTNLTEDQVSPWVRGLFVLGWSLAGAFGAITAVRDGSWNGWGLMVSCQAMVFIHAGWPLDMFKKVLKDSQMVLLIVGLAMALSFGGLIISSALR